MKTKQKTTIKTATRSQHFNTLRVKWTCVRCVCRSCGKLWLL